jgi:transcriptional regulator with XRE-family HTH domain
VAAEQTGTLLWEMRTAGGWTLGRLAQQAGVSKMALSRWEAGTRQPRIPELEAVLKALNANAAQKARIFATINAPRAIQHLRTAMTDAGMGDMPSAGDLLRAMRLRQGWTQGQTAAALHVTQATVARWEKGERLPDNTQVHTLCYVLGAKEEELLALTTGQFTDTPAVEPANSSAAYEELTAVFESGIERGKLQSDLFYLLLERKTLPHAVHSEKIRPLLGRIYAAHAQFLRNGGRAAEAAPIARRALQIASPHDGDTVFRAAIMSAAGAVYSGAHTAPQRGIGILRGWVERTAYPAFAAWMVSEIAGYLQMLGQNEQAVEVAEKAYEMSKTCVNPTEPFLRRCDWAKALLVVNRPNEALKILPNWEQETIWEQASTILIASEAHRQAGNLSKSHDLLQQAQTLITMHQIEILRPRLHTVMQRF